MKTANTHKVNSVRASAGAALCAFIAMAILAGGASAKTVELIKYDGAYPAASFDGTGSVGATAPFPPGMRDMGIFQETGQVFVGDTGGAAVYKFNSAGAAEAFSALAGKTVLTGSLNTFGDVFVDNSSTATKGRIYAFAESNPVRGYEPSGAAAPNFPINGAGLVCGGDVAPDGSLWIATWNPGIVTQYNSTTGVATGASFSTPRPCDLAIDSQGNFYTVEEGGDAVRKYNSAGVLQGVISTGTPEPELAIDLSNDDVYVDYGTYVLVFNSQGTQIEKFGLAEGAYPGLQSSHAIAVRQSNHRVYVANEKGGVRRVDRFGPSGPITIPTVTTSPPETTATSATLNGIVNADGVDTTQCKFEWGAGTGSTYANTASCLDNGVPTNVFTGASGDHAVTASIPGLTKGNTYHFRLVAKNANEVESRGSDIVFNASSKPLITAASVSHINTDGVQFDTTIDPEGGNTTFQVQYGTEAGVYGSVIPVSEEHLISVTNAQTFHLTLAGLTFGTTYHYRVVAKNDGGTTTGPDHSFVTYVPDPGTDPCVNAQERQQTESSLLPDCRAYELASARNSGGYDVESDVVPGQTPLVAYPQAHDRLLYSIHAGLIPGIAGSPTNYGTDPYLATRGKDGWTTEYVGLPADGMADDGAFGSPLLGADSTLQTFAFGGAGICNPCYGDNSINVPLRRASGTLERGMAGTSNPAADPAGEVRRPLSADGSHLVFGADKKFELAGKEGSASIYDRDLTAKTVTTQVVSTLENGETMGGEVGELDISEDGSRIVVGQKVSTDVKGNEYWHLFMHIGNSPNSVDLTPGAVSGAVYDGMSGDGSRVFFTTKDHLLGDTDASTDIYEAAVDGSGALTLRLITTKGGVVSNDDSCLPAGIPDSWNTVSGEGGKCNAVAFAGGAGVASGNGTFYFASPELLDGALGKQDQANLYIVKPGGDPEFVAMIDTSEGTSPQPPAHPAVKTEFGGSLSDPAGLTVDQSNGDVYVPQFASGKVTRFKPDGSPDNFSALGSNSITGFTFSPFGAKMAEVAVDSSPGPANGRIYVVNGGFGSSKISVYAPSGNLLTTLTGSGNPEGGFGLACGVAVDQSNGSIYVGDAFGQIWRYTPSGATVTEADYSGGIETGAFGPCGVAAAAGKVYVNNFFEEEVLKFQTSDFALGPLPSPAAVHLATGTTAVSTDPVSGDVYVDQGNHITVFDSTGAPTGLVLGTGQISGSVGVAVRSSNHHVFATRASAYITEFGFEVIPYAPIDNPAIVHGVQQSGTHSYGDFQITPDGQYAAFNSDQPLTGFATLGFGEIYRYDSVTPQLDCVSCAVTGASPSSSTSLPRFGLALTDDGRVFFSSRESFTLRDTNEMLDAYEWSNGALGLISTGIGTDDSGLMTVSADGVNAFFYTREKLDPRDENGSTIKVYVAREKGGFLFDPASPPCAASDECHGAGSPVPPPPNINTHTGSEHQNVIQPSSPKPCAKGKVRRHGKCVKPHRHHRRKSTRRDG